MQFPKSLALACALFLPACAASTVSVNPNYDVSRLKRIAVLDFEPLDGSPESSSALSVVFEKHLLGAGFSIIERSQVERVLSEQHLQLTGAVDPSQAVSLGKILGVDALVFGTVTTFKRGSKSMYLVDTVTTRQEPILVRKKRTIVRDGKEVSQEFDEITGYKTIQDVSQIPQVYTLQAEVAAVVRMIDTASGEIIWVGNSMEEGVDTQTASEMVARTIVGDWRKTVKRLEARSTK